ncbi:MAG: APC family permease [Oscillospiraceae bacterium]|nr:APC family permease [Oscillospiraceae bacterium]
MSDTMQNLNRTLKRMDLLSIAVGQIIGSGVMVMSIAALGMTGRSVNIAFVIAAIFTCFGALPTIFMGSTIRALGGFYTQAAIFVGDKFAGFYAFTYIFNRMSMAMFGTGLASYTIQLIPGLKPYATPMALAYLAIFFILNYFGTEWMAKVQTIMFYLLIIALIIFTVFGLPKVHWAGYFGNELFDAPLMTDGISGLLEAATYLTFATGGATVVVNFSAEAVDPVHDIPVVVIFSTVAVAVLYAFMACVIGGVLPAPEVIEAGNLGVIAYQIMPLPVYYFFMVCGAMFAIGTTLNSSIANSIRPLMMATQDGWFPAFMNKLNKHKAAPAWLLLFFIVNAAAILLGMNTAMIGKLVLLLGNVNNLILAAGILRLPKLFPEAWAKSPFHVSDGMLKLLIGASELILLLQAYMNCKGQATWVLVANAVMFVAGIVYVMVLSKSGKVHVSKSYELM